MRTSTLGSASEAINIRPGVSILSVLRHLNYRPWYALAEFVDNSLQSYLSNKVEIRRIEGDDFVLRVSIDLDPTGDGRITIRDNAAGILGKDFDRAFRAAELPPDRSGLSEFGMGMKSAACWFAERWSVRTSALGEPVERTVSFDIQSIVRDDLQELSVRSDPAEVDSHFTEVVLSGLGKRIPKTTTIRKIKAHLASIYRAYIREGSLELRLGNEILCYTEPDILRAPYFKDQDGEQVLWHKPIDLDFGLGLTARGFVALRAVGSTSDAGLALFRRRRLIQGSRDDGYRPEFIFGKSNSYTYQRLFGELELEGFDVSHTKDGIRWEEHEEIVLDLLREEINRQPLPMINQAEGYRSRPKIEDVKAGADLAAQRTAETVAREAPSVLQQQSSIKTEADKSETPLPDAILATRKHIDLVLSDCRWSIKLDLSDDPAIGDWISISDVGKPIVQRGSGELTRDVHINLALAHPFMERFGGVSVEDIEPLLRVGVGIALAEITARDSGVAYAGTIRQRLNELLRDALAKP